MASTFLQLLKNNTKALIAIGIYFIISHVMFGRFCPSMYILGIPCPASGMTRAGYLLLTGHLKESLSMHPLCIPVIIAFIFYIFVKSKDTASTKLLDFTVIIMSISFLAVYFIRMYLYFPNIEPMVMNKDSILFHLLHIVNKLISLL